METFRHNIEIENNFDRELYQTEKTLINKDNEISHEIYTIKFGLIYLSFQHHSNLHDATKFNEITDNLETLHNLLRFYNNIIMAHDDMDFYCNTNALKTDTTTCIQLRESYIHTTDTTLEAELAVHDLNLSPTILTTCELEYSQGNLHITVIHNTYNTKVQDSTKTREIQPTDIFLLHDDFIVVQLLQNNEYAFSCYPPNSLYLNNAKYECSQQATLFLAQQLNSFSLQLHGQNLLKQAKIISDPPTDIHKIPNYLDLEYKHSRKASKNFRKISHPIREISLYQPNFSKKVSQPTGLQTYKRFRIIWKK